MPPERKWFVSVNLLISTGEDSTMPYYTYYCRSCERKIVVTRRMSDLSDPYYCPSCAGQMSLFFTPPQLITQPFHLREGWRPRGSVKELIEQAKQEEAEYERSYEPDPTGHLLIEPDDR